MLLWLIVQKVSNSMITRNFNLSRTSNWCQSFRYISLTEFNQKYSSSISYENKIFYATNYDFKIKRKENTLFNRINQTQSFSTSNFIKRREIFTTFEKLDYFHSDLSEIFQKKFLTQDEWSSIVKEKSEKIGPNFFKESFDTYILKKCLMVNNVNLALSYINVTPLSEMNFSALCFYFALLSKNINSVGDELFLEVYSILKKENHFLPVNIIKYIIEALCNTKFWNLAVPYIKLVEKSLNSETENKDIYNHYSRALIRNKSWKEGMDYLISKKTSYYSEEFNLLEEKTIKDTLHSINQIQSDNEKKEHLMLFSEYLQNFDVILDENNAEMMCTVADGIFKVKRHKIRNGDCCHSCGSSLITWPIDMEIISKLKNAVENSVVKGPDIFRTTTPREWQAFVKFLELKGPFDVVIDGLNLLFNNMISNEKKSDKEISEIFKILRKHYKNILIVSRVHTKLNFERLKISNTKFNNVWTFYLDNITKDDVYILYAALYSGLGCKLISRDYLRNHLLVIHKYEHLAKPFSYWQRLHQLIIHKKSSSLKFFQPYQIHRVPQYDKVRKSWHIPVQRNEEFMEYFEHQDEWICISDINARANIEKGAEIEVEKKVNDNSAIIGNFRKPGMKLGPRNEIEDISVNKFKKVSNRRKEFSQKRYKRSYKGMKILLENIWEEDMNDVNTDYKRNKCRSEK